MFTDVVINKVKRVNVPKQGYYVNILWEFKDGSKTTKVGPFPENRKDLLVEFLNIVERMFRLYPNGKIGLDNYESVEGYDLYYNYIDLSGLSKEEAESQRIRNSVNAEIPCEDSGHLGITPSIKQATVDYYDGVSSDGFDVMIVMDTGTKFEAMYADRWGTYHRELSREN